MTADAHSTGATERLRAVVRRLSLAGVEATAPGWRPDDLAIEFDEVYTVFVGQLVELPSEDQLRALQVIDDQLHSISAPEQKALWTAEAVRRDPVWESIRTMARQAILAFEWMD